MSNAHPNSDFPIEIATGHWHIGRGSREFIEKRLKKLDERTSRFPTRACHVALSRHERDGTHEATLTLTLPGRTLTGHATDNALVVAFDRALHRVVRQLNEYKALLRRDHLHQESREAKVSVPETTEHDFGPVVEARDEARFKTYLSEHLDHIRTYLRREVGLLKRRHPDLRLTVDDLVDDVVMAAMESFPTKPHALPVEGWLFRVASDVLEARAGETFLPNRDTTATPTVPLPPDEHEGFDGLHRLLFYTELDPEVRGEHVEEKAPPGVPLVAPPSDPAASAEEDDLRRRVAEVLAELPRSWRRAFTLHYLEGFDFAETAQILLLNEDQVRFRVRSAEQFLRDRLRETAG